ncbi:MAG: hypothetical protein QNJ84_13515 [Alphaproteobacteria bacterium]|nr:hypothetical protein [Alphaproteobacteria bacterium]
MPKHRRHKGLAVLPTMLSLSAGALFFLLAAAPVSPARTALAPHHDPGREEAAAGIGAQPGEAPDLTHLRREIAALRDAGRRGALTRLETDRTYSALKAEKRVPEPLGEDLAACLTTPNRACLLREALAQAYRIDDRERRDWMLEAIAGELVRAGLYRDATTIIALVDDPRYALRIADAINAALTGPDETTPTPKLEPFRAVSLARRATEAAQAGAIDRAQALLDEAAAAQTNLDGAHARAYANFEIGSAWILLYQHSAVAAFRRKARALAGENPIPGYRARLYLQLAAAAGHRSHDPAQDSTGSDLWRAEQAIAAVAPAQRRVFLLTGLRSGAAPPDVLARAHQRAAAIAAGVTAPFGRAQSFLRLAATLPTAKVGAQSTGSSP